MATTNSLTNALLPNQIKLANLVIVLSALCRTAGAIETTNADVDVAQVVGADAFYSQGYTGSRAIVATLEGGYVWNGHETLAHVTTQLADPSITGHFDKHATWVGSAIAGRGPTAPERGIAYDATLWSGALADEFLPPTPSAPSPFHQSGRSFVTPYMQTLAFGVNGTLADVVNSSYINTITGSEGGRDFYSIFLDVVVAEKGKTLVVGAGNFGPTANTIGSPASGTNALVVGAVAYDESNAAASFSSRSPSEVFVPTTGAADGTTIVGARARIDLTVLGTNLTLAHYGGATGGNQFGGPVDSFVDRFDDELFGTSFASAIVAGGAALVVDAGKAMYAANPKAIDGRVVKAVLMNGAAKPAGWDNGQTTVDGVVTTTQSLDYVFGAGTLNLAKVWRQFTAGDADLPELGGGNVGSLGWDFGNITHTEGTTASQDYFITEHLTAGSVLTATLNWYSIEAANSETLSAEYGSFDNLDLQVWFAPGGAPANLVGESKSLYNSAEHLSFALPADGTYLIRVVEDNFAWNLVNDVDTDFGLAWSVTAAADFDDDGDVDASDFGDWSANFDISGTASRREGDADGDRDVDGADFLAWQRQLDVPAIVAPTVAVPELPSGQLIVAGVLAIVFVHASMVRRTLMAGHRDTARDHVAMDPACFSARRLLLAPQNGFTIVSVTISP